MIARIANIYAGMTVRAFWIWIGIFIGGLLAQTPALAHGFLNLSLAIVRHEWIT